ncbi:hypothetical protein Tco_0968888 [Tanacetum coccineum]
MLSWKLLIADKTPWKRSWQNQVKDHKRKRQIVMMMKTEDDEALQLNQKPEVRVYKRKGDLDSGLLLGQLNLLTKDYDQESLTQEILVLTLRCTNLIPNQNTQKQSSMTFQSKLRDGSEQEDTGQRHYPKVSTTTDVTDKTILHTAVNNVDKKTWWIQNRVGDLQLGLKAIQQRAWRPEVVSRMTREEQRLHHRQTRKRTTEQKYLLSKSWKAVGGNKEILTTGRSTNKRNDIVVTYQRLMAGASKPSGFALTTLGFPYGNGKGPQCEKEPVEILEREFKKLKRSRIAIVKVRWNSKRGPEFTWEREDQMKLKSVHMDCYVKICDAMIDLDRWERLPSVCEINDQIGEVKEE